MVEPPPSDVPTPGSDTIVERPGEPRPPPEGAHIGRYLVLGVLGHGGMGVVLSAYDPQLDRPVALKLLHAGTSSDAQVRLQREARALARLAHPNVIRVHDVGVHDERVFVAMEQVRGGTLADWMKAEPRDWRQVLRVFARAGEGLAAAHAAGLVHRDFKPSNVLMGDDGQVKVTDFGLARAQAELEPPSHDIPTEDLDLVDPAALQATLTRTGALVGTPAYMAPEQLGGRPADPRSDLFGFCVALFEALAGRRPFDGSTPWQILAAIERQRFATTLPRALPSELRRAVLQGLRVDPRQRPPDVPTLLATLRRSLGARRRRTVWAVAAAMVGGGAWWAAAAEEPAAADYCAAVGERLDGVWDDELRARAERAFLGTERPFAADTWDRARRRMDEQALAWTDAQRSACEAQTARPPTTTDDPDPGADALTRRMVCLHRRLAELRGVGELLADADAELVERAPRVLDALGSIDSCDVAGPRTPDDPSARAHAEGLASITVLSEAGRYDDAVAAADEVVEAAAASSRVMQAEAALARARALEEAGRADEAERDFHEAFAAAIASDHHEVALRSSLGLATQGSRTTTPRFEEAERWTEHAAAAVERLDLDGTEFPGRIENVRAQIDMRRGDYEAALEHATRALELRTEDLGDAHYLLANYHNNLGHILGDLQRQDESLEHLRRALGLEQARYGEAHPRVARAMSALCATYSDAGRVDEAIEIGTRAVSILRSSVGEEHPLLGTALINLGSAHARAGHEDQAERAFLDALANVEAVDGPGHRRVGLVLNNLGVHYEMTGRLAEAERYHRRAVELFTTALGPAHPTTAIVTSNLASVLVKENDLDAAERLLRDNFATLEERLGPEHPDVALPLGLLAQVLMDRGRARDALPMLERVLTLRQPGAAPPAEIADTQRALGEALWITDEDRPRAIELVRSARDLYAEIGEARRDRLELVEAWLRERDAMP